MVTLPVWAMEEVRAGVRPSSARDLHGGGVWLQASVSAFHPPLYSLTSTSKYLETLVQ
jgi:hypothetical protein